MPVDGIWRSTGVGVRLSPTEADAAAESVDEVDLLAVDGKTGVDTAWLREQLDMPSDLAD